MISGPYRLTEGGRVDRSKRLSFTFDGKRKSGFAGDTLASALLASGTRLVGRSFKYHRPRGVLSNGPEEPNALVEIGQGSRREPNTRATMVELYDGLIAQSQNRWPSLSYDVMSVNQLAAPFLTAGFYYKTFMWPRVFWESLYEPVIRRAAGLGRAPEGPDPDRYENMHGFCDVLVVGSGPAGLAAAKAASDAGARVILADERAELGGSLLSDPCTINGVSGDTWALQILDDLSSQPNVRLLSRTTIYGQYDHGTFGAVERVSDHLPPQDGRLRQRAWRIVANQVVVATGHHERPLAFLDNDRPGVMLASAALGFLQGYGVAVGRRPIIATSNDLAYRTALAMAEQGVQVEAVLDARTEASAVANLAQEKGLKVELGARIAKAHGAKGVKGASYIKNGVVTRIETDAICVSGGFTPVIHLLSQRGDRPTWDEDQLAFVPGRVADHEEIVGAAAGELTLSGTLEAGRLAGVRAAERAGFTGAAQEFEFDCAEPVFSKPARLFSSPPAPGLKGKAFIDFQNDATEHDVHQALDEGYDHVELMKRYTTLGMATDQGKTANVNAMAITAEHLGKSVGEVGTTTFRPPYTPVSFGAIAGGEIGQHYKPKRLTPMHDWHIANGAVMTEAGLWMRPWYYPRSGEDFTKAVAREVKTTRTVAGLCDVSTLGKIEIIGSDAAEFLNRLYCNGFKSLPVGKARYGLMLREDGIVYDDGTTSRLADGHFFMTTTTANAGPVMAKMDTYHQVHWPELDVRFVSVSDEWAQMSFAGPKTRDILSRLVDIDMSTENVPPLAIRDVTIAGVPGRIYRISFSGELAYEIGVPAPFGEAVFDAILKAGETDGACAYGLEALAVMRIEKGHIAGTELDGRTTAADLGLGKMMSTKKDYIGRVMAQRPGLIENGRRQLVGVKKLDDDAKLFGGANLTESAYGGPVIGWITTVVGMSPTLGYGIGLALLEGGLDQHNGKTLYAHSPSRPGVVPIEVQVVSPHFYDPKSERQNG